MADLYDQILVNGSSRYRKNNIFIKKDNVPTSVLDVSTLDNVVDDTGNVVVDQKNEAAKKASDEDLKKAEAEKAAGPVAPDGEDAAALTDESKAEETDDPPEDDDQPSEPETPPAPKAGAENVDDDDAKKAVISTPTRRHRKAADDPKFRSKVPQSQAGMGFPRVNGKTVDLFDGKTPHTHVKLIGGLMVPLSLESFNTKSDKDIEDQLRQMGYEVMDYSDRTPAPDDLDDLDDDDDEGDGLSNDHV